MIVDLRTLKLTVEYDGTNYVGWQRQAEGVSIQGLLEEALAPFEGGPLTVHGAGRTDAGVHALGQVASVRTRTEHHVATLQRALNAVLPVDVRVVAVEDARPEFHARFDAVSKTYEYRIANGPFVSAFQHRYVWHVPGALDVEAMHEGAQALLGRHDFAAFQVDGRRRPHHGADDPGDRGGVRPRSDPNRHPRRQTGVDPGRPQSSSA